MSKSAGHASRIASDALAAHAGSAAKVAQNALAAVASPAPAPTARPGGGKWLEGRWGLGPFAMRRYRLYLPPGAGARRKAPLLLLLHGCQQDSASFAACARVGAFGREKGVAVLMPEQSQEANPQRCWSWFGVEQLVAMEAAILMSIVDHVGNTAPVRTDALFALGMSAGGAMSTTLALRYPERFAAVGCHSGAVADSASSLRQAGQVLRGRREPDPADVRRRVGAHRLPPLLVIHGDLDLVVAPANAPAAAHLWVGLCDAADRVREGRPTEVRRGARRSFVRTDWTRNGAPFVRLINVRGLGHAWSGGAAGRAFADASGPDALRLAWAWFAPALERHR
ncbi:MAG: prolyl oligopeptidase family serine peptidase [Rhodocyclaceae bacterium]|nr:prolyl oligopeptidase family serine peptidase [Rhodocyclaceae bacterium]